jgi:hypothetical protein
MELDISLGQDERVYREYEFSRSFIFSLLKLKSHFWLTIVKQGKVVLL